MLGVLMTLELGYKAAKRAAFMRGWTWQEIRRRAGILCRSGRRRSWTRARRTRTPRRIQEEADIRLNAQICGGDSGDWDVELWQEMEKDPEIRRILAAMQQNDGDDMDDNEEEAADAVVQDGVPRPVGEGKKATASGAIELQRLA
jgi:hypothetical protein